MAANYVGIVWPGPAVFPDFTRAQTRDWWGGLYKEFVQDGVAGFWNDMNEPAVFDGPGKTMPLDNIHRIEEPGFATRTATHSEIHNIVGLENARATYEGLLKLRPDERPFVLTRATFAGGQRYGFTWTGDNSATWNHLRLATQQLLNLGLSGISFVGDDIGGFNGSPPPDLLTRWIEVGAFNPMFRDHTTKGSLMQEVWVHGPEQEAIRRRYIETRYRLLPYIYTLAEESSRTGLPMVRPIFLEFPEVFTPPSNGFGNLDTEFLLGPSLLVAPQPFAETMDNYVVSFPERSIGTTSGPASRRRFLLQNLPLCKFPPISPKTDRELRTHSGPSFTLRSTRCRYMSGAEVSCRCSPWYRVPMKHRTARWSFGFIPAPSAAARSISTTATLSATNTASSSARHSPASPTATRCGSTSANAREAMHPGGERWRS